MNTNSDLQTATPATSDATLTPATIAIEGTQPAVESTDETAPLPLGFWSRAVMFAGMIVLGVTPWAQAQLSAPNQPAFCPPLTSIANPTLFNLFWGTTPIRFPYQ